MVGSGHEWMGGTPHIEVAANLHHFFLTQETKLRTNLGNGRIVGWAGFGTRICRIYIGLPVFHVTQRTILLTRGDDDLSLVSSICGRVCHSAIFDKHCTHIDHWHIC